MKVNGDSIYNVILMLTIVIFITKDAQILTETLHRYPHYPTLPVVSEESWDQVAGWSGRGSWDFGTG